VNYPTPESLRELAKESMDDVPAEIRDDVRALYLAAADAFEQRGFYVTPGRGLFLISEAKALAIETRGITDAGTLPVVPGWRCYFEGKVRVNDAGTDLEPILAVEATETKYGTHKAAVIDGAHAMKQAGLKVKRTTKAQKQQPVYILPSYIGVATDWNGKVIA
jgi:hypothetical protein